ncbi:YigZ family protein, partial [Helicobacter sp. 23-1044]
MKTIKSLCIAEYEKDGSKFLAHLAPAKGAEQLLSELQEKHKKAVHFVRASRAVNEFRQIIENSSDDGEPKGSSGVPVLNVLRGRELVECACIVVRYFGGKLLGIGGLVRAYSNATLLAVENAKNCGAIVDFI